MKGFRVFLIILAFLSIASCIQDPLVERNEPEAPEFSYSNATRTSVTLIGHPKSSIPNSHYGFVVYVSSGDEKREYFRSGYIEQFENDNSFRCTLSGLTPGMTYYVRAYISNGKSQKFSDESPFSTPSTSKATVSMVALSEDGLLSARLLDDGGREVEEMGFVVCGTPELQGKREIIPAQMSGNVVSIPLSYFSKGKYFIYAYADNTSENGEKETGYSPEPYALEISDQSFVNISDPGFLSYLIENYDLNKDGNISYGELKLITSIDLITDDIASIDEVCLMPDLVSLVCRGSAPGSGGLVSLDVSQNRNLVRLDCSGNKLDSIDVSSNNLLETLICSGNRLTNLGTFRVPLLDSLDCSGNMINSVDLSRNAGLQFLDISGNPIGELNLAPCLALKDFRADNCSLVELDFIKNQRLEYVSCMTNPLDVIALYSALSPDSFLYPDNTCVIIGEPLFPDPVFKDYIFNSFDKDNDGNLTISEIRAIEEIDVNEKNVASLEGIQCLFNLKSLDCRYNNLSSLDLSENKKLTSLYCNKNQLTSLDVSGNTTLTGLSCGSNQLTSLDISKNVVLKHLDCQSNQITSLDISINKALDYVNCDSNQLTSLDVSNNTSLTQLWCQSNQITSLDVSRNTALTWLYCGSNQLTSLDISKNVQLNHLGCYSNQITSLDVSRNTALTWLSCGSNQLTSLDVSRNTALTRLFCGSNQLTSLDVSNNTSLTELHCYNNQLTTLDVSTNTALYQLGCAQNQLTSLDVSRNTSLTDLRCYANQLVSLDLSANKLLEDVMCDANPDLSDIWLSQGQTIQSFSYPSTATIHYKE